jgi:hypothetical protein
VEQDKRNRNRNLKRKEDQRVNVRSTEKKKEAQPVLGRARGTKGTKQEGMWRLA